MSSSGVDAWWRQGVVYQIYPRSFQDSNGDGIGDLAGIVSRLDYLGGTEDSLGIDAIWLSPFFPSPHADFGYDVADYCDVDPDFGTLRDFDVLVSEAHRRGIRVIVDLVLNHTSDRHPWFQDSRSSRANAKRDWFVWAAPRPGGAPPNGWLSVFQTGPYPRSAWTFDERTGQFYYHSFLPQQPDLNWWNGEVREAMHGVIRFWLDRGVDGFRLDAVQRVGHDPELRNNIPGEPRRDEDLDVAHDVLRGVRRVVDEYPDRVTVGEVYLLDLAQLARYYGNGKDELDLAFNFSFLTQPWSASGFRRQVKCFEGVLPGNAWPNYTLSNHDHSRIVSRYDEDGRGEARARVAGMMLLTLRGTPFLYYGEELGMRDVAIDPAEWQDRVGRDAERTPMQWQPGPGGGFTSGRPWLPLGDEWGRGNVATESADESSMLSLYRQLLGYRHRSSPLTVGIQELLADDPDVFAFVRASADERVLVVLNLSDRSRVLDPGAHAGDGTVAVATDPARTGDAVRGGGGRHGREPRAPNRHPRARGDRG
jgi:alpha-glucosidase